MTEDERNERAELEADIQAKNARAAKLQREKEIYNKRVAGLKKATEARKKRKEHPLVTKAEVAVATENDELSPTDIKLLEEEARKEIRADRRKRAKADMKAAIKRRLEQEMGVTEAEEKIFIELGGNKHNAGATYIAIDGVRYCADRVYKVRAKVAEYLRDLMQNCDSHQCEIEGQSRRYNRLRNTRMGPAQESTPASALMRV